MDSQNEHKKSSSMVIRHLLCFLFGTVVVATSLGQGRLQKSPEADVRGRIAVLMSDALRKREITTPEGPKLWVPIPPSHEAFQEVNAYGDKAVVVLAEYIKSGNYHERELAMEFLSSVGGSRIVEPLLTVIRYDPEPRLREAGIEYLSETSWEAAAPILKEVWKADPDSRVREKAKYILESHEGQESKSPTSSFIRTRIAALMEYILKKGEGILSDGTRVRTASMSRPSNEDIKEIKHYGDDAVPILSDYLTSDDDRRKNLAMRFLGILGGSRIVEPLTKVIRSDPSPSARETALRWLTEGPWDLASPILQQAEQNDPDPGVRRTALELLGGRKPK